MPRPLKTSGAPRSRFPRAEFILAAAIALVLVLVTALVFAMRAEDPARARTMVTIALARTVRNETLALSEAMTAAEAARGDLLAGDGDWTARRRAQFQAHANVARLRAAAASDPQLADIVERIAAIVEEDFARDDAAIRTGAPTRSDHDAALFLRGTVAELIQAVNVRNDAARHAEKKLQDRLDGISIALALLSLVASALAILSLRRERRQWRVANAMAEGARARATASDLAKTRFLAAASHDMRQPLHALTLYLAALKRRVREEETRGILSNAERAAQSLVSMFAVLLDLARIEANVVKPHITDVSVQEMFDRLVAENPGADVAAEPTNLFVRSDSTLIERMLRNLVANALKHGGGQARLSARERGGDVEISVRDNGPGIAPEDQKRIFDEFVRLDGRSSAEGLGLGLNIVRRLGALMGHGVELRSAQGQGATFSIRAARARAPAPTPEAAPEAMSLAGRRVIVVDDDALARSALAGALSDLGAEVRACASEQEFDAALTAAAPPNIIMLDLRLNGRIVGFDIARRLGARLGDGARLVIVTGDTGAETLSALRASGHRWLIKPVDPRDLAAALS